MSKSKKNHFSNKVSIFLLVVFFGALAGLICYKMYDMGYLNLSGRTVPIYDDVPNFKLIERSGKEITKKDLLGHIWIADFIFTRCAGQCPIMSLAASKLTKELPQVRFISFTSDPEYDIPQVLSTYAGWYQADPEKWLFLTGDKKALNDVAAGLKLTKIDDPSLHSNYFVLIDKKGRIRGYYDANDAARLKDLKRDIGDVV